MNQSYEVFGVINMSCQTHVLLTCHSGCHLEQHLTKDMTPVVQTLLSILESYLLLTYTYLLTYLLYHPHHLGLGFWLLGLSKA